MSKKDLISHYTKLLPDRITVRVERTEDGLWAQILELPHCYTQAASASELTEMLNDAIQTHFEIPEKYKKEVGYYVPLHGKHVQYEEMFRRLVSLEQKVSAGKEVREIFQRENYSVGS